MPQNTFGEKSTLVQVMAWSRQATSHYLSQYWQIYDAIWRHYAIMSYFKHQDQTDTLINTFEIISINI